MTRRHTSHTKGVRNGNAKLTEAKARWIREITAYTPEVGYAPGSIERAADETGCSQANIRKVATRKGWTHVE